MKEINNIEMNSEIQSTDALLHAFENYLKKVSGEDAGRKPERLYKPIDYVLSLGGKRIRPLLLLASYNMYRQDVEKAFDAALAIETYHNFTLLHDDVMDHADVRRGKPTVHKVWDENTAILSGDTMLIMAMKRMTDVRGTLRLFMDTALEIDEGQQMDMDFESRTDVTEAEYVEMIRLKTAVLLGCALKTGALLGGAADADADLLYKFGEKMGLAFQLQDDYLDVYGDPKVFGKPIGGDIAEGKKTFMLINAYLMADDAQKNCLDRMLALPEEQRQERIAGVTRLYTDLGVDKKSLQRIEQYFAEAIDTLDKVNIDASCKRELRSIADMMLKRKK